jgi:hypothetical protein
MAGYPCSQLAFRGRRIKVIGYVSTIVGISGFKPRTRLCLIQDLRKREGDLIFEWSFFYFSDG